MGSVWRFIAISDQLCRVLMLDSSGDFETNHDLLKTMRHIPSINPTHDRKMSPVEGYTFVQLRSMQNVENLLYSPGANKYICIYILVKWMRIRVLL